MVSVVVSFVPPPFRFLFARACGEEDSRQILILGFWVGKRKPGKQAKHEPHIALTLMAYRDVDVDVDGIYSSRRDLLLAIVSRFAPAASQIWVRVPEISALKFSIFLDFSIEISIFLKDVGNAVGCYIDFGSAFRFAPTA